MSQPLNKQQKEKLTKQATKELGELHPQEAELLLLIRKTYRFGRITIETRDGLPFDILETVKRTRLGEFSGLSPT